MQHNSEILLFLGFYPSFFQD